MEIKIEENYGKELKAAIIKAKDLFNIGNQYNVFNERIESNENGLVFHLSWSDKKGILGTINISIDSKDNVLSYNIFNTNENEVYSKNDRMSYSDGLEKAKVLINKLSPDFYNKIRYKESKKPINFQSNTYDYYFVRSENSVPYYGNSIQIALNIYTGRLENYFVSWENDLLFSNKMPKLGIKEAKEAYREKIGLDLVYRHRDSHKIHQDIEKQEMYLVYLPTSDNFSIHAISGDLVESNLLGKVFTQRMSLNNMEDGQIELGPEERASVEKIGGLISKEEAEGQGRRILEIYSDYILDYSSLYKNKKSQAYNWKLSFRTIKKDNIHRNASIVLDAKTKELVSLSISPSEKIGSNLISKEEAFTIAKDFIEKYNFNKSEFLEIKNKLALVKPLDSIEESIENKDNYDFYFSRRLGKAFVEADGISVYMYEGKISSYNLTWTEADFDSQEDIIGVEKAYECLFDKIGLEIKYIPPKNKDLDKEAQLVYGLKDDRPHIISAKEGSILSYDGDPYKEDIVSKYLDIEDSYAKEKIQTLAEFGISFPGDNFYPKKEILEKDFLAMLVKSIDFYYIMDGDLENLCNRLYQLGIVKDEEVRADSKLSKEDAVKFIVRALKLGKVPDLKDIFVDVFLDSNNINPNLKGYVAISRGLGIVEENKGYFNPRSYLSREEGADFIYNFLFLD